MQKRSLETFLKFVGIPEEMERKHTAYAGDCKDGGYDDAESLTSLTADELVDECALTRENAKKIFQYFNPGGSLEEFFKCVGIPEEKHAVYIGGCEAAGYHDAKSLTSITVDELVDKCVILKGHARKIGNYLNAPPPSADYKRARLSMGTYSYDDAMQCCGRVLLNKHATEEPKEKAAALKKRCKDALDDEDLMAGAATKLLNRADGQQATLGLGTLGLASMLQTSSLSEATPKMEKNLIAYLNQLFPSESSSREALVEQFTVDCSTCYWGLCGQNQGCSIDQRLCYHRISVC